MEPYLGEIRMFSFSQIPQGWLPCDGRILVIQQYVGLYSLLSTQYGGDGKVNFALPDLRGRVPANVNPRDTTQNFYPQGKQAGAAASTLTAANMPIHSHTFYGTSNAATATVPTNNLFANTQNNSVPYQYVTNPTAQQIGAPSLIMFTSAGGSAPVSNLQPYEVLNFCIAIAGIFPPRN
jgi:microcystin-dependent protein